MDHQNLKTPLPTEVFLSSWPLLSTCVLYWPFSDVKFMNIYTGTWKHKYDNALIPFNSRISNFNKNIPKKYAGQISLNGNIFFPISLSVAIFGCISESHGKFKKYWCLGSTPKRLLFSWFWVSWAWRFCKAPWVILMPTCSLMPPCIHTLVPCALIESPPTLTLGVATWFALANEILTNMTQAETRKTSIFGLGLSYCFWQWDWDNIGVTSGLHLDQNIHLRGLWLIFSIKLT